MVAFIQRLLGLSISVEDQALVDLLARSRYRESMRVVGRGTVVIPPEEIRRSPRHLPDLQRCQAIVEAEQRKYSPASR